MASKIKAGIAQVAMNLFADRGYHGVATRDIAKQAKVTEASIYRLFATKDGLFKELLEKVVAESLDPAKFLMIIYEGERTKDIQSVLTAAILEWYSSISVSGARLLTQAYFMGDEWRELAYKPINKIAEILATTLERNSKSKAAKKIDFLNLGRAPIMALLQFKITYASSTKQEKEVVTSIVQLWLRGVLPAI